MGESDDNKSREPVQRSGGAPARRSDVDQFLGELEKRPPPTEGEGRLIFALDATLSRQPTWDQACQIQGDMFLAAAGIGGLSVQLVFFRGHGEMKASRWVRDGAGLLRLMNSVRCRGGLTQIGKLLRHSLAQTKSRPIQAIVYVGDACEELPDELCDLAGELGIRKTPLFIFHEGGNPMAGSVFREMARLSGGAYAAFDSASAAELRDLLRAVATYAAGGLAALKSLPRSRSGAVRGLLEQME